MARRSHAYPQVRVDAAALVDVPAVAAPAGIRVGDALRLARRRDARLLVADGRCVLRDDLVRAQALGLDALGAGALARALPTVDAGADEVAVRRALAGGAPLVAVRDRRGIVGAVAAPAARRAAPVASLGARFTRAVPDAVRAVLARVAELAAAHGARAFAVGGLVRDVCRDAAVTRRDLDVVVEGDGLRVARHLADALGGTLTEHPRFLTASVEAPGLGRIDVATSRAERYETPGALPRVLPAGIAQDLARRDFTVNALAVELASGGFGLLDPFGGRADLARRRLAVLHPLSYVEDPTRLFRAGRYAVRLGLAPDAATRRAQALALAHAPYPALSGQRLATELERVLAEARPDAVLLRLAAGGVLRLLHPRWRLTAATRRRLTALPAALAWAVGAGLAVPPLELALLALLADQPPALAAAALDRLGLAGEPRARVGRGLEGAPALGAALLDAGRPSARARLLRERAPVELAWLWLDAAATGGRPAPVGAIVAWFAGLEPRGGALGGEDVIALGVPRGPAVARVLAELRDARLDGTVTDRAMEEDLVRHRILEGG